MRAMVVPAYGGRRPQRRVTRPAGLTTGPSSIERCAPADSITRCLRIGRPLPRRSNKKSNQLVGLPRTKPEWPDNTADGTT